MKVKKSNFILIHRKPHEAYIPQSLTKSTSSETYTPGKGETKSQEYSPLHEVTTVANNSTEDLFGIDSETEVRDKTIVTQLSEKYANLPEYKPEPKVTKRKRPKHSKTESTKTKSPKPAAQKSLLGTWISKGKKEKKEKDDAAAKNIESLEKQRLELKHRTDQLKELNAQLFPESAATDEDDKIERVVLTLTELSDDELKAKFDQLFRAEATEAYKLYKRTQKLVHSPYNLTRTIFTPEEYETKLFNFMQDEFGKANDMGKYTAVFGDVLVPNFAFALFKDEFIMTDEEARKQIAWQKKKLAKDENGSFNDL